MINVLLALGGLIAIALVALVVARVIDDRKLGRIWRSLEVKECRGDFSEALVRDLPAPVLRYFCHAISSGVPLHSRVSLRMFGRIKPGTTSPWMRFTASQILTPHQGFVWKARVSKGPIFLDVDDHYSQGSGRTRVVLFA
jgi:hypothetical protein